MNSERPKHRQRAFTLIELLLALAVLAVVATIVLPSFLSSYFQHRAMDQAVASVMESMATAKQLAVQSASPYVYEFNRGTNVQFVYPLNDTRIRKTIPLPLGIRLESDSRDLANSNRMIFRADGSTEGLIVAVVGATQTQSIEVQRRLGIPQRLYK